MTFDLKLLPDVVGIAGVAGSGKSTLADFLIRECGYTRVKMAGPLKRMCSAIGLTNDHIEGMLKERPSDMLCGKTPRYFMQRLGTDFGRDMVGRDLWTGLWARDACSVIDNGGRVVCDDIRFPNELFALQEIGGITLRLARSAADLPPRTLAERWKRRLSDWKRGVKRHPSETSLDAFDLPIVMNNGSIENLYALALMCLHGESKQAQLLAA